jgi:uncharacterized membrane protein
MRAANPILLPLAICTVIGASGSAFAQMSPTSVPPPSTPAIQGLWLTTAFPVLTARLGEDVSIDLALLNRNLPPSRVEVAISGLPDGWKAEIEGNGNPVGAAFVQPDQSERLTLKITPSEGTKPGGYAFTVTGKADGRTLSLPIDLTLAEAERAEVVLEPKLPALRGSPNSKFDFQINVKNESPRDEVFNLVASAPDGFQATFKEQYGTQELTSIPVKANEAKDITLSVTPPQTVPSGQYQVMAQVGSAAVNTATELMLDVTGQPTLSMAGPEGRLSGDAVAGKERTFNFTLKNDGTAPARDVKLTAGSPTGWKVTFDPERIPALEAGQEQTLAVSMTPSDRAVAGDYVVTVRANGEGASADASFRVTVLTSTLWGIAGLGVIGAALLVFAVAVTRYGRR